MRVITQVSQKNIFLLCVKNGVVLDHMGRCERRARGVREEGKRKARGRVERRGREEG